MRETSGVKSTDTKRIRRSGQHVYVDAEGNVQPCVLLKTAIGNILQQRFKTIWNEFIPFCKYPVRECLVHFLDGEINNSPIRPLPRSRTLKLWQQVTEMEPTDIFKKIKVRERDDAVKV